MTDICLCAICRDMLHEGDQLADCKVYKNGELSYIELAHRDCAILATEEDGATGWEWGQLEDGDYEPDPFLTDAEADADVLASAGYGTDEDYGYFGE